MTAIFYIEKKRVLPVRLWRMCRNAGIQRIINICKDYGVVAPKFDEIQEGFRVVLFKEKLNNGLNDGLNKRQLQTLHKIIDHPGIKAKELSEVLKIPIDTIDRYIRILVKKGLVERKGSKKTGGYFKK